MQKCAKSWQKFPEFLGNFPRSFPGFSPGSKPDLRLYLCILPLFLGGNSEIPKFPKFPEIPENPGEIPGNFDKKKINLPAVFSFPPLSEIREISGENFREISGKFREISENSGNFWKFFPRGHFPKFPKFGGKPPQKRTIYRLFLSICPFLYPGVPEISGKSRKINFDKFGQFSEIFFRRGTFRKIPGKISWNFNYKKYNLPAVNECLPTFIPELRGMFPETSGKLFWKFFVTRRTCPKWNYKDVTYLNNTNLRL